MFSNIDPFLAKIQIEEHDMNDYYLLDLKLLLKRVKSEFYQKGALGFQSIFVSLKARDWNFRGCFPSHRLE